MRFDPNKEVVKAGLIGWFIKNPVASTLATLILIIGGLIALTTLRAEVFPSISQNTVVVSVVYPGATPSEVEEGITRRVEEAVLGLDGVERVRSTASENRGTITVELADFADRQKLKDDIEVELTEGTLTVRSAIKKDDDGGDNDEVSSNNEIGFVHRGIAKRAFSRSFQLSDDIIVKDADLADGMLIVNLERVIPDEKKPRLIPIGR